jgi:chemotaxis protein histidine kinase CheA
MNMTSLEARSSILNELAGGHGAGLFLLGVVNHEKHPAMNSLLASLGYANFDEFWTQLLAPDIESDYWIESLLEGRDPGHDLIRSHLKALESAPASACLLTSITSSFKSNMTTEAAAESANQTLDIRASEWETIKKGLAELADSVQGANHASLKQLAKAAERATHKSMKEMCLKLGEMVEDFSRGLSKKVRYQVHGEDLYLAPAVLNTVRDVLVHLLRNSLDHGIESEDERRKLGKNPKASLEIVCNEKDGLFEIKVIDDGKGIDGEKVLKKAVSMGQVSAEKAQTMSSMDKINLIFMANLSTKESVSGISGRGVGMDAVKMMVEGKLQGQIRIDTESNKGTVMTLLIPEGSSNLRDLSQAQAS